MLRALVLLTFVCLLASPVRCGRNPFGPGGLFSMERQLEAMQHIEEAKNDEAEQSSATPTEVPAVKESSCTQLMKAAVLSERTKAAWKAWEKLGMIDWILMYQNHDVVKCTEFLSARKGDYPIVKNDLEMSLYQVRTRSDRWSEAKINRALIRVFKWPSKPAANVGPFEKLTYKLYFAKVVNNQMVPADQPIREVKVFNGRRGWITFDVSLWKKTAVERFNEIVKNETEEVAADRERYQTFFIKVVSASGEVIDPKHVVIEENIMAKVSRAAHLVSFYNKETPTQ